MLLGFLLSACLRVGSSVVRGLERQQAGTFLSARSPGPRELMEHPPGLFLPKWPFTDHRAARRWENYVGLLEGMWRDNKGDVYVVKRCGDYSCAVHTTRRDGSIRHTPDLIRATQVDNDVVISFGNKYVLDGNSIHDGNLAWV